MTSSASQAAGAPPVPAPPRDLAAEHAAAALVDWTSELDAAGDLPLQERAAALTSIQESLAATLRDARV